VEQISFKQGSTVRMTTTKQYDFLNRLTSIASLPAGASAVGFAYEYNPANQRTVRQEADGSYWRYEYDALGQVRSGRKYWADGTPVAGQQFEYAFDDIGNRIGTGAGGNEGGTGLRSASYSANLLNQYSSRTVPGAVDVMGMALATNAVTVNGQSVYRKGEYFRKELGVNNNSAPVWTNITVAATGQASVSGNALVPKTPEAFTYDADGNLTSDSLWTNVWNAENRLISMQSVADVPAGAKLKVDFAYDQQGRRVQKVVSSWNGSAYVPQYTNRFVYDGWNLVAILNSDFSLLTSFTWGLDLSGTMEGAGGVGGLLWMTVPSGANAGTYCCAYDANGNVMALVGLTDGTVTARYEYGPFGELLRATGPMAKANPFRFSTKYQDDETDLLYYGYRFYNASTGRWLSRDPLGEHLTSFSSDTTLPLNPLYAFCLNDPTDSSDYLGLACWVWFKCVLSGQQSKGIMKSCIYNCVENTSKQRETRAPGMTSCEDLESKLPKPMTTRKIDTISRCVKCNPTMDKVEAFDESWNPITDCSRSKCLQDLANTVIAMKATCALLKGPPKVACSATVQAIEAAGRTACDLCKKP